MKLNWKYIALLFLSAAVMEFAFAPFNQFYTAFFSLLPFLYVLEKTKNGFLAGMIWGIFYSIFSIHWLALNTGTYWWLASFSMLLGAVFLALNYAVIGWIFKIIQRKHTLLAFSLFPFIWVTVEFLRSFGILGFPWLCIGHSQAYNTLYIQQSDIGGVYTVSLMLLITNVFLYLLIKTFSKKRFVALIAIVLIPFLYGIIMVNTDMQSENSLHFRVVQPNIGAKEKWVPKNRIPIVNKLDSLSRIETEYAPDVIVWPETAVPYYLRSSHYFIHLLNRCARDMQSTLITGALDYFYRDSLAWFESTNSIFIFEPENTIYENIIYDKIHLVPFGEFTPAKKWFSWLNNMEYGQSDFSTRNTTHIMRMTADSIAFTPMICYDSVFPHTVRRSVVQGSKYNILITNDIWFGRSMGPHQHAAISVVRAVETRRPLIRAANAGISMFIDEKGRVLHSIPLYTTGIIDETLAAGSYTSLYVKTGNLFSIIVSIIALFGFLLSLWIKQEK